MGVNPDQSVSQSDFNKFIEDFLQNKVTEDSIRRSLYQRGTDAANDTTFLNTTHFSETT